MSNSAGYRIAVSVLLVLGSCPIRGAEALLIPEVITREVGIQVGGLQTPEMQDLATREVGIFVGAEPDPPSRETMTRETEVVMVDEVAPPRIEDIAVTVSPTGHTVTLDWSGYARNEVRDLVRFDIYYSSESFNDIAGMVPMASVGSDRFQWFRMGFPEWQDHYFAVVPVDGLGNRVGEVVYSGAYVLHPEVVTRETGFFNGSEPDPPYREIVSREVAVVVSDPAPPPGIGDLKVGISPTGHTASLDWGDYPSQSVRDLARYDIYYSTEAFSSVEGREPLDSVWPGQFSWLRMGFPEWKDHFFAVVPVDAAGNRIAEVTYSAAYVLSPEATSREVGLFNGSEGEPLFSETVTREVGIVVPDDTVPRAITGVDRPFSVNISKFFHGAVNLDWTQYNLWEQRDVVRYRIFYSDKFFSDVREPSVREVPGGLMSGNAMAMVTAPFEQKVYYFAVVAEDSSGNFDPVVYARSTRDPISGFMEFALNAGVPFRGGVLPVSGEWTSSAGVFSYTRSKAAAAGGTKFLVEWSDDLSVWHREGVKESVVLDDGVLEHVRAIVPKGKVERRFMRLNVGSTQIP